MRLIRKSSIKEVFNFLGRLASEGCVEGYNVHYLSRFSDFSLVEIDETEFWNLIFLNTWEVQAFYPESSSITNRRLRSVVRIANLKGDVNFSNNWDIGVIRRKTREFLDRHAMDDLPPIVLIPYKNSYYIQDGNHRCLGLAMAILNKKVDFKPIKAFMAIDEE